MKKYFLLFVFLLPSCFCFAQNEQDKDYKWGIGVQLNSLDKMPPLAGYYFGDDQPYFNTGDRKNKSYSAGLVLNYFFSNNRTTRIKIGISNNHFSEHREVVAGNNSIEDVDFKQKIVNFCPGIFWNMKQNKLLFYGGFEMPILIYAKLKSTAGYVRTDPATSLILEQYSGVGEFDGGFAIGPGIFSGFNIQANKKILIGGEFSILYRKVGGDLNGTYIETIPTNQTVITVDHQTIQNLAMPRLAASLNITYLF